MLKRFNTQGELTAIERGRHALHSGMDAKAYAASAGRNYQTIRHEALAAEVAETSTNIHVYNGDHFRTLVEIHAAPSWLWPALVERMLADENAPPSETATGSYHQGG